ncbi:MAG: type II toxin-antitoxin system RelE/ParE family toxin [Planctomycetota bacterium]|nr:type II toxin-antitoxin system RelE/ParE family toxin [Planctomycetota bacterium]MDA1140112.1 type II toxin-antitoxin system RelE/ParE family toxin [Planctomycetota bacterium]
MAELIYHPEALSEAREVAVYYESNRDGLGREFLKAVDAAIERIEQFPEAWRKISGDFRRILLRRFPYGIIYSYLNDVIYVVAVMHLKRKPGYWKDRLEDTEWEG